MHEVSIIGGGIGGLALANTLKEAGINFHLYERAPQFTEVGAGIGLSESTLQILRKIDLYDLAESHGKFVKNAILANKQFETIRVIPTEKDGMCIDRTKLIELLTENLVADDYSLSSDLVTFEQSEDSVQLNFASGKVVDSRLLVACDGINSGLRKAIYPNVKKRYLGQTIWRGIAHLKLPEKFQDTYFELWGDNLRFGVSPMTGKRYYWYAVKMAPAGEREAPEDSQDELMDLFSDFDRNVIDLISNTPKIVRDDMWDLKPHKHPWTNGRVVFLGDAIHATTPNLAQGGCQAIEDAYVLAKAMEKYGLSEKACHEYERLRREKTTYIVNKSWQFGKSAHSRIPFLVDLNAMLLKYVLPERFFTDQYRRITDLSYLVKL